jgi:hypothetical protein
MVFWTVRTVNKILFYGPNCVLFNANTFTVSNIQVDNYQETGCPNMLCPGFVLMNQALTPGMVLPTGTPVTMDIEKVITFTHHTACLE